MCYVYVCANNRIQKKQKLKQRMVNDFIAKKNGVGVYCCANLIRQWCFFYVLNSNNQFHSLFLQKQNKTTKNRNRIELGRKIETELERKK